MKKIALLLTIVLSLTANDIIVKESCTDVSTTANNIKNIVSSKGLSVFAIINHSGNAKMVDMKLNESKMIVFGNPKLGTALMQQDMTVGLDLPLRILVYKDTDGKVKMAYRDGSWLASKHILNAPKKEKKINKAMAMFVSKAGQCSKD
ncbi:DUF302 domain-containing protein [Sulfurimonas sp. SAG-AH-194-C20]|nr:DUF302 domain-containing protein [Sulfurimonas sp. SAG-AH-194-C20]MDF1878272.1 DUF302 domain-containing protein [Sulfurimonas sp. SAG-AH-194-C20]